jgi:hypothetical protein
LRRDITQSGLFWALVVVLGVMCLAASIVGLVLGPPRMVTASVTLGIIALIVLGSYGQRQRQAAAAQAQEPVETAPSSGPRLTNTQYRVVQAMWAAVLVGAVIAMVAVDGGKPVAFGIPAAAAIAALTILEVRRRRDAG